MVERVEIVVVVVVVLVVVIVTSTHLEKCGNNTCCHWLDVDYSLPLSIQTNWLIDWIDYLSNKGYNIEEDYFLAYKTKQNRKQIYNPRRGEKRRREDIY